ncbi:ribonuclease III [Heliocybe sulcata]|uniref:Ribonuclease III n=1 Tax=Heliocybe sulcata TaxID=5364 RepID=A0A5C3NDK5_9AGAM|nr:ribonuclease III [Heliocybe sulcata]
MGCGRPHAGGDLPPLPAFKSPEIERQVFTHRSLHGRPSHLFEDSPEDPAPDNEKLEHQGDAVLSLVVTDLMREEYPYLRVGPSTKVRSLVVTNAAVAAISQRYRLSDRLRQHIAQSVALRASARVQADLFEAYVGGLYIDQGMDAVKAWLNPLLRPYVQEAYDVVKEEHSTIPPEELPSTPESEDQNSNSQTELVSSDNPSEARPPRTRVISPPTVGHLSLFNQHINRQDKVVEWVYNYLGTRTAPMWAAHVTLNGESLGIGTGRTKKLAKDAAARIGLDKMGVHVPDVNQGM